MGATLRLTAEDLHEFAAYFSSVTGSKMGVVVLQEIFGVNHHIRNVVDRFAAEGFTAIAPALFDRKERNVELGYEEKNFAEGKKLAYSIPPEDILKDVDASINFLKQEAGCAKVGVVGFCFGGSYAWLSATRLRPDAAVSYYGAMVAKFAEESPHCPVMLHFGAKDENIPADEVAGKVLTAHPGLPVYLYDAGHGFSCDARSAFDPHSAALAWSRTLELFQKHLAA